jgi:endo-1,4-beta-xylanase
MRCVQSPVFRPVATFSALIVLAACGGSSSPSEPPVPEPIASISVDPGSSALIPQQTVQLSATARNAAGEALTGRAFSWSSGSPSVATVSASGQVTGVAAGTTTITATSEGKSGTATVTVQDPPVANVVVTPGTATLVRQQTTQLNASVRDALGGTLTRPVTWSSGTPAVVTVSGSGLLTAVGLGTSTISATSEGKTGTATVTVVDGGTVGPTGGTVTSASGAVVITVPAGAVASPVGITVAAATPGAAHPGLISGTVWELGPAGTTFNQPVTVKIKYEAANVPTGASPMQFSLRRLNGSTWTVLPGGAISPTDRTVSATTTGFSTFGIVRPVIFPISSASFDDGTTGGWAPSGPESVVGSATAARTGASGLLVTNRSATWQGAGINLTNAVQAGKLYTYRTWVRAAPGQPSSQLSMSMEWRAPGVSSRFELVASGTTVTDGAWVQLQGNYIVPTTATFARLKVESSGATVSYWLDDFSITQVEQAVQQNIPALHTVVANQFKLGTALTPSELTGAHRELILKHFNSITPGNDMKWSSLQPTEGNFAFAVADQFVDFAMQNGIQIRGHTLLWHNQVPAWVFQDAQGNPLTPTPANKALLLSRLENHIRTVGARYAGKVAVWDVVNEVIDQAQPDGLRRTPWYNIIGPEYIARAFIVAREVLPNAKLVINDYQTEVPAKREALFTLVSQLKAQGVPVDGVGHQFHVNLSTPTLQNMELTLQRFIPLGVDQEITEMDISIYNNNNESFPTAPADRLIQQANRYRDFFDLFRRYADNISTVTIWGNADDLTWLDSHPVVRKDYPLLFDEHLTAKPAYWGIVDPTYINVAPYWARSSAAIPRP